jgi:hypothetical protein
MAVVETTGGELVGLAMEPVGEAGARSVASFAAIAGTVIAIEATWLGAVVYVAYLFIV